MITQTMFVVGKLEYISNQGDKTAVVYDITLTDSLPGSNQWPPNPNMGNRTLSGVAAAEAAAYIPQARVKVSYEIDTTPPVTPATASAKAPKA